MDGHVRRFHPQRQSRWLGSDSGGTGGAAAGSRRRLPHSADEDDALDSYGRASNPTWRQLESALAELEGATAALTFGSGMAAITSVLRVLAKPRSTLVVPADGYYQVRRYAAEYLAPQGVYGRRGDMRGHMRRRRRAPMWCWPRRRRTPAWTSSTCTAWR